MVNEALHERLERAPGDPRGSDQCNASREENADQGEDGAVHFGQRLVSRPFAVRPDQVPVLPETLDIVAVDVTGLDVLSEEV